MAQAGWSISILKEAILELLHFMLFTKHMCMYSVWWKCVSCAVRSQRSLAGWLCVCGTVVWVVRLKFDMENTVYLTVTAEHLAVTRGLCGVYNNNPDGENVWPGLTYLQNLTLHSFHAFLMHYILAVVFMQYAMRCFYFIQMTSPPALEVCLSMLPALETHGVFKISKARWETPSVIFHFFFFLYNWKSWKKRPQGF